MDNEKYLNSKEYVVVTSIKAPSKPIRVCKYKADNSYYVFASDLSFNMGHRDSFNLLRRYPKLKYVKCDSGRNTILIPVTELDELIKNADARDKVRILNFKKFYEEYMRDCTLSLLSNEEPTNTVDAYIKQIKIAQESAPRKRRKRRRKKKDKTQQQQQPEVITPVVMQERPGIIKRMVTKFMSWF